RLAGEPATERSDVYSAGVSRREALAGSTDASAVLPASLAPVVVCATATRPADRFPSARAFAEALDVRSDRTQVMSTVPPAPRRRRRSVGATMFGTVAVLALSLGAYA